MKKYLQFAQTVSKISDVICLKTFYPAFAVLIISHCVYADDVSLDVNDEIDPNHNNGVLVVSDEKKITRSNYSNYGVMTIDSGGILNVEKEFNNIAQNDDINDLYLATFNIDGGVFNAYSMGASHGNFRNFGFVNIANGGVYNNDDSVFYSEKNTQVDYENTKPRTLIDSAIFNNYASGTYKNLMDSDTYIQNSARFVNSGLVLNDTFSYFKLDSASVLENLGSFENDNTLKIVNSAFENSGNFKNSDSVEINSGSLHNNESAASIASSGGTITVSNNGEFYNESGDVDISGGTVDVSGLGNFTNSSTVDFSGSSVLKIRDEVRDASVRRLALSNSGTLRFIGTAKLDVSGGSHTNTGEIDVCDNGIFLMSGGLFTNSAKMDFSDTSSFSVSGGTFVNSSAVVVHSSAKMDLSGGIVLNNGVNFENNGIFTISNNGVFSNSTGAAFVNRGSLSVSGGEFEQSSTAIFLNSGTTVIDSVFKFYVDRTNLAGVVNNESGVINLGQDAEFKVVLSDDFADADIANLEIVLINGNGELNDEYGIVMSAVMLEWEDGTSADSDFVWNTVFGSGNMKVVITSYVPEAADAAFFAGVFAILICIYRGKIRSASK